jgi:hypothetical protein
MMSDTYIPLCGVQMAEVSERAQQQAQEAEATITKLEKQHAQVCLHGLGSRYILYLYYIKI